MLAKAPLNPIEYGGGTMTFAGQQPQAFSSDIRMHRGTKYQIPTRSGVRWNGWIESYGQVTYDAANVQTAEQSCIRQIERLIKSSRNGIFAQRAS